jgi:hypothetical protein
VRLAVLVFHYPIPFYSVRKLPSATPPSGCFPSVS